MKKAIQLILAVLGISKLPVKDAATDFTPEQLKALEDALEGKVDVAQMLEMVNKELAAAAEKISDDDQRLIDARAEIEEMLKAHGMSQEDLDKAKDENNVDSDAIDQIKTLIQNYSAKMDEHLKKLLAAPEANSPLEVIHSTDNKMQHSKTHLFGSKKEYDAFEGRPWNQMAKGEQVAMPTFAADSLEVQKLQNDADLYYKEVKADVKSLNRDFLKLPSFWPIRTNVVDRIADGNIVTAEVTQARKKNWLPKNKQLIQPEEAKIYPVQVDIEHAGYLLQTLLTSWLHQYNKEGSQAYKWSFVKFLLVELDKRARQEDRIVAVKGVYVPTPDSTQIPGLAIHRSDGILIKLWRAYFLEKKFKSAQIGAPTNSNIVDYVKNLLEKNVPLEEINSANLILYLSQEWIRRHVERKRVLFGHDNNYTGQELMEIENFPNVKLCPLSELSGSDFMFITYDDNIEILENIPSEKSMYHMESLKRDMYIFADYKFGVRVRHIGTKVKDGDPAAFKVQTVWTNGMPIFNENFFVRLYDYGTGEININEFYSNITITNDYATNIETINGAYEGQIIKIQGNTAVGAGVKVVDDGNITLAGNADFNLNSGGILTLRATTATTFTEVKRTTSPPVVPDADVDFSSATLDADLGYEFNYTGGVDTLEGIIGGVEGQEIVINGGAGGALTLQDVAGNINVGAGAVLADGADNITLTKIDGVWEEVARTIA